MIFLELLASGLTLWAIKLLTDHSRWGVWVGFAGQWVWVAIFCVTRQWGFMPAELFLFYLYLKGCWKQLHPPPPLKTSEPKRRIVL